MNGLSAYHRLSCAYAREDHGQLLSCIGPSEDIVRRHWADVWVAVALPSQHKPLELRGSIKTQGHAAPKRPPTSKSLIKVDAIHNGMLEVYERQDPETGGVVLGILFHRPSDADTGFDDVFCCLLLDGIRLLPPIPRDQPSDIDPKLRGVVHQITDLFDSRLRYISENDRWNTQGREFFFSRVYGFVQRGSRVEFCLPAFPCKSSNLDKVMGVVPDRGEQLALENLHSFMEAVERIYEPGAKLWIVSDGHVFSDCIGVDDRTVDLYSGELIRMNAVISKRSGGADRIGFKSLVDMFNLANSTDESQHALQLPALEVHIPTQRTRAAELSRQILLQACRSEDGLLRTRIASGEHSVLKLYRGFSRFMTEDLRLNRHTKHLSRCKLKKLAAKVSFEMLQRNEAYSNLVELFFPHHVRLSIHAHDNAGPKFGIRLLGGDVRAVEQLSLGGPEMRSVDLLHVPTPWHNCLAFVAGEGGTKTLVMTKAKVVKDALAAGSFAGGWADEGHLGLSGHFRLQKPAPRYIEASVKQLWGRSWDSEDTLDCCDPGNPYFWGPEAALEAEMRRHWREWSGIGLL